MKKRSFFDKVKGFFKKEKDQDIIPFNEELIPPTPPEFKTDPETIQAMMEARLRKERERNPEAFSEDAPAGETRSAVEAATVKSTADEATTDDYTAEDDYTDDYTHEENASGEVASEENASDYAPENEE